MKSKNRILVFFLTIIFMMVCSSAYSVTFDSARDLTSKDSLKDARQDANSKVAVFNDATLPVEFCAPRQVQSITSVGSSPSFHHYYVGIPSFSYNCFTYFISKSKKASPFRPMLSRYYYIIALERFLC